MPGYRIIESVGGSTQPVNQWSDIEHHHPSNHLHEGGRVYAKVNGKSEEVASDYSGTVAYTPGGQIMVSKDIILQNTSNNSFSVPVPSPANGYIGEVNPRNGTVTILDRPGGEMMFQLRHMKIDENIKPGAKVEYGQSLGTQSGYGKGDPNHYGTHLHIDANVKYLDQADRYVRDIAGGRITTDKHPANVPNIVNAVPKIEQISGNFPAPPRQALADGKIEFGEKGPDVALLQEKLRAAGARDAQGREITQDGSFGNGTKQALEGYQKSHNLPVTGVADQQTLTQLGVIGGQQQNTPAPTQQQQTPTPQNPTPQNPTPQNPTPTPTPTQQSNPYGFGQTNELGKLIGGGEGGYNSYNRGVAGDARGAQIDFSQLTVGEVMRRQDLSRGDPDRLFAVGKYQFTPDTLEGAINTLGIDKNAKFTPQLQEKMFADYLVDEKRPQVKAYITGQSSGPEGLERAQHALALEFASVGDPRKGGRGAYDGDSAGNSASIKTSETATALNHMREQYQKNIQAGQTPDQAYRALSGDPNAYTQSSGATGQTRGQGGGLDDKLLVKGEDGAGVKRLQESLNAAGIKVNGQPLPTTGHFGDMTEQAVKAYQQQKGLEVDGKAGKDTLTSLGIYPGQQQTPANPTPTTQTDKPQTPTNAQTTPTPTDKPQTPANAQPTPTDKPQTPPSSNTTVPPPTQTDKPLMSNPNHPDNKLYQQAVSNLEQLGPSGGFKSREDLEKAAAAVAADAKATGLKEIDHISKTNAPNGQSYLVAVQGDPTSPAAKNSYIDYNQATSQTVAQSTQMAEAQKQATPAVPTPDQQRSQDNPDPKPKTMLA